MSAIVTIEAAPGMSIAPDITCDEWLAIGTDLMQQDRAMRWQAADWMAYGRARAKTDSAFAQQMDLALNTIAEDRRHLDAMARIAEVFPAEERSLELSFDHYAALSRLPHGEARKLLAKAQETKATPREVRYQAMELQMQAPRSEPDGDSLLDSFLAHWNRLPASVREVAAERISEAGTGEIDL